MTDIVKGMVDAYYADEGKWGKELSSRDAMRAALLFLANNISDEMVHAYVFAPAICGKTVDENVRKSIAAAIRAAAGEKL